MAFTSSRRNSSQRSFSKQSRAQSRSNEEFADTPTKRQQKPTRTTASFRQGAKSRKNNSSETEVRPPRSTRRSDESTSTKRTTYQSQRSGSSVRSKENSGGVRRSGATERKGNQHSRYGTSPTINNQRTRTSSQRKSELSTGSTAKDRFSSKRDHQDARPSTDRKSSQTRDRFSSKRDRQDVRPSTDRKTPPLKTQSVTAKRHVEKKPTTTAKKTSMSSKVQGTRINKYLADSGVGSRRAVEELIVNGDVKVNRKVITDLATRIMSGDFVTVKGEPITDVRRMVYILLNKPKDVITTADDEFGRKTVLDLVKTDKRLFPVGRLDRNTTGVLLLTNDGELAHRLTHPSYEIPRVYNVTLNAPLDHVHAKQIARGVMLDDGEETQPCEVFIDPLDGKKLIIELREGKNREVRRIFEKFGYDVRKLDRKFFATLSTRGLARGKYRVLTRRELSELRQLTGLEE